MIFQLLGNMSDLTGYPICKNGDVLIVFSPTESMQLHSELLARHSTFFKKAFKRRPGVELNRNARGKGVTYRWRFDLDLEISEAGPTWSKGKEKPEYEQIGMLRSTVRIHFDSSAISIVFRMRDKD